MKEHAPHIGCAWCKLTIMPCAGAASGAGAASALVGCPAELLMIQQQKTGEPLTGAVRRIASQYGVLGLYRGLVCFLVALLSHFKHHMLSLLWKFIKH